MVTVRGDSTDVEWHLIGGLVPPERGRPGKPALCNRTILDGILFRLRTGCPWRDLPERFGKWNTVWRRFARWRDQGLFELILDAFAGLGRGDGRVRMLDSTVVRAHQHASGGQRGLTRRRWAARGGGVSTKMHLCCDGRGLPLAVVLTPGQAHESTAVDDLLEGLSRDVRVML